MLAKENPGVSGVAAMLPKNPGTQKLTPPSSARASLGMPWTTRLTSAAATRAGSQTPCQTAALARLPHLLMIRSPHSPPKSYTSTGGKDT